MEIKVEKIGEEVKRLRKEYNMSQPKLAKAAGLNVNTVSRIERGITKMDLTTLSKLMFAFGDQESVTLLLKTKAGKKQQSSSLQVHCSSPKSGKLQRRKRIGENAFQSYPPKKKKSK